MQACRSFCAVLPGDPVTATNPETCNCQNMLPLSGLSARPPTSDGTGWLDWAGRGMRDKRQCVHSVSPTCHASTASHLDLHAGWQAGWSTSPASFLASGATRHTSRHAKKPVSLSPFRGACPQYPFHGAYSMYGWGSEWPFVNTPTSDRRGRNSVPECVGECASIHDMSVVNVPHIHDAHQW